MQRDDYLKDYYKSLEEAAYDVLEEYEDGVISFGVSRMTIRGDWEKVKDKMIPGAFSKPCFDTSF